MPDAPSTAIRVSPPLVRSEIEFLAGFAHDGSVVRRVWPGQPTSHCPWRPADDGRSIELDAELAEADPETVAGWLRFLVQEFLAPASTRALTVALAEGLRGGHNLTGQVLIDGVREIRIDNNRTTERVIAPERDAIVLQLDAFRREPRPGVVRTSARLRAGGVRVDAQTCVEL